MSHCLMRKESICLIVSFVNHNQSKLQKTYKLFGHSQLDRKYCKTWLLIQFLDNNNMSNHQFSSQTRRKCDKEDYLIVGVAFVIRTTCIRSFYSFLRHLQPNADSFPLSLALKGLDF